MEHHWKKNIWQRGDSNLRRWSQSTDMLCSRPSCIPKNRVLVPKFSKLCHAMEIFVKL